MPISILKKTGSLICGKVLKKTVRFGLIHIKVITPDIEDSSNGFEAAGFSDKLSFGKIGELDTFIMSLPKEKKRACAPISSSRLVQRRWRKTIHR